MGAAIGGRRTFSARDAGTSLLQLDGTSAEHQARSPREVRPAAEGASPEEATCLLGRLLFTWAFPVLWGGYNRGRLDLEELPALPKADQPERLGDIVCTAWRHGGGATITGRVGDVNIGPPSLMRLLFKLTAKLWAEATLYQGSMTLAQYLQPIMLHTLLQQLDVGGDSGTVLANVIGLAFMVLIQWVFAEYAWIQFVKCDLRMQAGLVHLVFRKSMYLPSTGFGYTMGQLQNLFATDASKAPSNCLHYNMTTIIETTVSLVVVLWHLTMLMGSAGLVGAAVIATFSPLVFLSMRFVKKMVQKQQEARDARGRLFNQFLSAMRVVKCFQLEDVAWSHISEARRVELKWQWRKRSVFPIQNFVGATASLFATAAAFTWLVLVQEKPLDPALAFTVLSWNNMLKSKIIGLPNAFVALLDTYVSVKRVQKLLSVDVGSGDRWLDQLPPPPYVDASGSADGVDNSLRDHAIAVEEAPHVICERPITTDFEFKHCDFGYPSPDDGHKGIHDLSMVVRPGELVLVCGPIGSGKTVMLEGLADILQPLRGVRRIGGRSTAYVAQRPWLINGTLLENVTFGQPHDAPKLDRIVECCSLGPDIDALSDGIHTLVGEEGVQLSGGQKQRVSLARAMYSGADVVLMDDVMSALDAHVGRHIWEKAICGMLGGRTRVVATHQVQYCSDPSVSQILVLDESGNVEHSGTYKELCDRGVNFGVLRRQLSNDDEDPVSIDDANRNAPTSDGAMHSSVIARPLVTSGEASARDAPNTNSMAELRRLGAVQFQDFVEYLHACGGAPAVIAIFVLLVGYYGAQFASNFELAAWANANAAESKGGGTPTKESKRYLSVYLIMSLATGIACLLFFLGIQLVSLRSSRVLHERFTNSLLWTELRFFDMTPTGRVLNRCLKDFQLIDDRMPAAFRELIESLMNFVLAIAILLMFAWEAILAIPIFGLIYWWVMNVYRWPARDLKRLESLARSPMMGHFSDCTRGAGTIRAYRHDVRFMRQNLMLMGDVQRTSYWFWTAQGWVSMVQEVLGTLLLAIIAGIIGFRASAGYLNAGLAGLALSYAINMPRDLMWLSRRIASMEIEFVSIERVLEYVRLPPEEVAHAAARVAPTGRIASPAPPCAINAEVVWLRYGAQLPWVLQGLSLRIPVGARAAVVGRTGCGKSSFLSALARLYPTGCGHLLVHGKDVMETPLSELRRVVRVLLQDPIFFSGSIRSNLLCHVLEKEVSALDAAGTAAQVGVVDKYDVAILRALRQAGLERLVLNLPHGIDELVEDGGQNFSYGERQLLCLARVLLDSDVGAAHGERSVASGARPPRVLLCDEPTSACDLATDQHIHETLLCGLPELWTLVVVCHRLHRIREFSSVYVLDGGKVAEQGNPASLLGAVQTARTAPDGGVDGGTLLAGMCRQQGVL